MRRAGLARTGGAAAAVVVLLALLAPVLAPNDPRATDDAHRLAGPSAARPLGTDQLGRCVLSRALFGARLSLLLTLGIVAGGAAIGTGLGGLSGHVGGKADLLFAGLVDLVLSLPRLVVALVVVGLAGPSIAAVAVVLVALDWTGYARVARGVVLREKEEPWVLAERALGFSRLRILLRSLLPATVGPVLSFGALRMGGVLLAVAGLGFLGLGVPPPSPEWGAMIGEGRIYLRVAPWIVLVPSLFMVAAVAAFGLLAEGLGAGASFRRGAGR